ncbi:MAG: ribosome maturation factor RimM [Carnobacterium sp.]|uniref:Ribosome maturation factor RimM n=1 Tax=Carnobacterium antarcticum TaxID=2126436 RepID=A0ABW4NRD9_9LACT|nr:MULTISPECIES: ribosome maturation factor RimM [unclassified Carnobacterium]ALV20964.1 16S rRNA processing protein RimM [Carnobacterium sp. CP1]QQP71118.1 ribosome maturation factor RimM [Carnobacterium sp. CS13]
MADLYNVGKIVNTQGIKGEVRVISRTDFPDKRYKKGSKLLLEQEGKQSIELTVASHRKHKTFDILSFENHPSINDVEKYRDGILKVTEDQLGELPENEYYLHQIIGLTVQDEEGTKIGKITEVLSPGANDVWVIQRSEQKDLLIPYIEDVVLKVDLEQQLVTIHVMEGLLD